MDNLVIRPRHRRVFHKRYNPLEKFNDRHFVARYRLPKEIVRPLAAGYGASDFCSTSGDGRGGGIGAEERFCVALRFLATGCNYSVVADYQGVHKSTLCRCLKEVSSYLASLSEEYIKFPRTRDEQRTAAQGFFNKCRKPCVIGLIDGTHVPIMSPRGIEDYPYVNRKFYHSLNVMVVVDYKQMVTHVDTRFPGRVHDSFVLRANGLHDFGEAGGMEGYWLLGDSGYPLSPWLLTPDGHPRTARHLNYNAWHRRTRSLVERTIGVMKQRWRCLDDSAGYIMSPPETCAKVIVACCVLHNIAIEHRVPLIIDNDEDGREEHRPVRPEVPYDGEPFLMDDMPAGGVQNATGLQVRDHFIHRFFPNRLLPGARGNGHANRGRGRGRGGRRN